MAKGLSKLIGSDFERENSTHKGEKHNPHDPGSKASGQSHGADSLKRPVRGVPEKGGTNCPG